ncbi:MAG: protein kinase [Deltaproteobacteria bacterium]|nr:protein kinase [Deltaproteobacteria bacterium]
MSREVLPARFGDYLLVARLATGGMAEVFLAIEEPRLGGQRFVAIKRVRADYADEAEFAEFFRTEGRVSLKVHHPNLPAAHRLDELGGRGYLVLEYLHGHLALGILRAIVHEHRTLSVAAATSIALDVARALDHLHTLTDLDGAPLGVIHRDVSPHNVIVTSSGHAKLIDLGIARAALQTHHTETGVVKGKYAYMAPEQLGPAHQLDTRADVFSLGVMIHEFLVGRPLFQGLSDLDTCERVRGQVVAHPARVRPDVPRAIGDVVMVALERDPERRWASAAAMVEALEDAAARAGVVPSPTGLWREALAIAGPAPLPLLRDGALVWSDGPARVRAATPLTTIADRSEPVDADLEAALDELPDAVVREPLDDAPTDDVPTPLIDSVPVPIDAPAVRDPALAYYLHVGGVPDAIGEEPRKPGARR